ncbi:hypothetical protein [Parapedobacter sp. 2B3]|uniref:DUF6933 domain-containing protein n=1 Tax=Parapedobacter sp. 2B3 TaxID=3342381 RepID=UPI0035B5ADD2
MHTAIHTSRKLEKLIKKWVIPQTGNIQNAPLGKWNATVFFVDRKKCWLVTNAKTQYHVILPDIKAADMADIDRIIKQAFYTQLQYDGISISLDNVNRLLNDVLLYPTDNDRSTTAYQNQRLLELDYWKHGYQGLEHMPIRDLTNRINKTPINLISKKRFSACTDALTEMKRLLDVANIVY